MRSGNWNIRRWRRQRALPAWSQAWRPCTRCSGMRATLYSPGALLLIQKRTALSRLQALKKASGSLWCRSVHATGVRKELVIHA